MPRMKTVSDAIADVRSIIDESNLSTIDDVLDILASLNRAQVYAFDILSKHYEDPLLFKTEQSIAAGIEEISLPENVFEDRVEKVEFQNAGYYYECKRISYRDITYYEVPTQVPVPAYYCIYDRKLRFLPPPDGSFTLRIWSIREPEELVLPQGRITNLDGLNITVDEMGDDLTANVNSLNNYINIIDGQTGEIKQSLQVDNLTTTRITVKASPDRDIVLNRTISGSILSTVSLDDYVCVVKGSCVPLLMFPLYNFLVQYTANEMNRKLKNASQEDAALLDMFSKQVERTWVGREMTQRVKMRSKHWMPRRARRNTMRG